MTTREKLAQMKASEERNADAEARQAEEQRMAAEARRRGLSWKSYNLRLLNYLYGQRARRWKADGCMDKRADYVRRYEGMIRGLENLRTNPDEYVQEAMRVQINRDRLELDRIIKHYEGRMRA